MTATKTTVVLGIAAALAVATAVYQSNEARATAVTLAAAGKEHATARARRADLESKVRAAERALADREKAKAHPATNSSALTVTTTPAVEVAYQKALQQYLDSNPELQMAIARHKQAYKRAKHWPVFLGLGLTPEQAERAHAIIEEVSARRKPLFAAGLKPLPDHAQLRAEFGDVVVERWREFSSIRWEAGDILYRLTSHLYHADEPFTPHQKERMVQILNEARTAQEEWTNAIELYKWDQVLAQAEPVLSPAQRRGLRTMAESMPMHQVSAAATKEAAAARK
jgi:hypothetical protein